MGNEWNKIPFVVCDAFQSERWFRRPRAAGHDVSRAARRDVPADRPISEFDGPIDAVRVPVAPTGQCKPFQEVLIESVSRPALRSSNRRHAEVSRLSRLHRQLRPSRDPASGFAGWRGAPATSTCAVSRTRTSGNVRAEQLRPPSSAAAVVPVHAQLESRLYGMGAATAHPLPSDPVIIQIYSKCCRSFAPAAQGKGSGRMPPEIRERLSRTSICCRSGMRQLRRRRPTTRSFRQRRHPAPMAMYHRGIRRTRGCARSTRTIISS